MNVAPLQFLLLVLVGWANRRQLEVLEYLKEETGSSGSSSGVVGFGSPMTNGDA
jgi:hypothetical protein